MRIGSGCGLGLMAALALGGAAKGQTVSDASLQPRTSKVANCSPGGDAEWLTPAEKTCYATTPDYAETMAYLIDLHLRPRGQRR